MFAFALPTFSPALYGSLFGGLAAMMVLAILGRVPLNYSLRNLIVRWRTTLLTALAFTLVIGLMIVMLAFVNGMSRLTEQSGQPGNVIVLSDGAIDELFSNFKYTETSDLERQPSVLRDENNRPMCSRETYLVAIQDTGTMKDNRPQRRFVQLRAIEDPEMAARIHGIGLYSGGQWFSEAGVQTVPGKSGADSEAIQAVLGVGIAREMGRDRGQESLKIGDVFELGGRSWIVVGITKSEGSTFGSEVWAKWSLVSHLFGKERYTSMVVRTADAASAKALADDLTTNFKKAALQATPETEYFERLNDTSEQFMVAILFVTGVMSVGGIFGVMNTMFAAVSAAEARYRRAAHRRLCPLAGVGGISGGIAVDCAGGRCAGLRPGLARRRLDRQQHRQRRRRGRWKIRGAQIGGGCRHPSRRHGRGLIDRRRGRFFPRPFRHAPTPAGIGAVVSQGVALGWP